jgi:broad specificity phosphatase PhoE
MKIYLFRHAEKASPFHPNPGLSDQGQEQASRLWERVQNAELPRPHALWVSPKKRARQSFQVLAENLNLPLNVDEALDEKQNGESHAEFHDRVALVFDKAAGEDGVIFLCTHMDWLEEAAAVIPGAEDFSRVFPPHWSPLEYVGLIRKDALFEIIEHKRIPL